MKNTQEQLEAHLERHPEDIESWLVLGDLLQERGDPRGVLIALDARIMQTTEDERAALEKEKNALILEHKERLLGTLVSLNPRFTIKWGCISTLNLEYNNIGDEGARYIAESKHLSHLTKLKLWSNKIGA